MRSVAWSVDGSHVFGCCGAAGVAVWDAVTGALKATLAADKLGVARVAPHPSGNVLATASTRVRLVKILLTSQAATADSQRRTLKGAHATECTALAWTPSGRYVASASAKSRVVLVHDCDAKGGGGAVVTLTLDSWPVGISCLDRAGCVDVAAARDDGALQVVRFTLATGAQAAASTKAAAGPKVLDARFVGAQLSVATAPEARPQAGTVALAKDALPSKLEVHLAGASSAASGDADDAAAAPKRRAQVLGFAALSAPHADDADDDAAAAEAAREDDELRPRTKKAKPDGELTLGEKLEALAQKALDDRAAPAGAPAAADARSLAHVLQQALEADDDVLIDEVVTRCDAATVEATLRRLPAQCALPLLRALASRIERKPRRAPDLAAWAHATLELHAAQLAAAPSLARDLARLQFVVKQRVATLPQFLALQARLALVLNRATAASARDDPRALEPKATVDLGALDAQAADGDAGDDAMEEDDSDDEEDDDVKADDDNDGDDDDDDDDDDEEDE
ncbi:Dip2/Utp12 family-domain-containing protein [Pelagophyceae sp. CCMP2097]|nr:Dip2/Utp12 family-domain-containing protein [Pelagophyceae sp. CCMP2097]